MFALSLYSYYFKSYRHMTLDEMRHKLKTVVMGGPYENMGPNTKCDIYIISLAWCGLNDADREKFNKELEKDYAALSN